MNGYWESLRPFEKRVVVAAGVLLFAFLNFIFVFPHFSDLSQMHYRMAEAQTKLAKYESEIAQTNVYAVGLHKLEGEGIDAPAEDQAFQFQNTINSHAGQSGVRFLSNGKINTTTNQFFLERSQSISVQAGEQQLVDFLYGLGSSNSLIRVRDLSLRPDPARQQLVANITLVASYQKKSSGGPRSPAPSTRAVASNPKR